MNYIAHSSGYSTGDSEGFSHFMKDNGIKILFITIVFAAATYGVVLLVNRTGKKANIHKEKSHEQ